jgi:hypothetical protein
VLRHVTLARVFGLLIMLASVGTAYWLLTADAFDVAAPRISGELHITSPDELLGRAALTFPQNAFKLRTTGIRGDITAQPAVSDATVSVSLPNTLDISVVERIPVFAIHHQDYTVVVDASGEVLEIVDPSTVPGLGVPVVDDQTSAPPELTQPGATIDPIELAAILQLGAVTPAMLDSRSTGLTLAITDDDGFVLSAQPAGWRAVFGQYTPNLRPTDMIPRQVQCLRSLIGTDESNVSTVYLAPLDQNCGTYLPDATPAAPTPAPTKSR